ncbi:MAG TPA: hypothetical protein VIQ80_00020 [Candidatus Saccharimonadales bacterium]
MSRQQQEFRRAMAMLVIAGQHADGGSLDQARRLLPTAVRDGKLEERGHEDGLLLRDVVQIKINFKARPRTAAEVVRELRKALQRLGRVRDKTSREQISAQCESIMLLLPHVAEIRRLLDEASKLVGRSQYIAAFTLLKKAQTTQRQNADITPQVITVQIEGARAESMIHIMENQGTTAVAIVNDLMRRGLIEKK